MHTLEAQDSFQVREGYRAGSLVHLKWLLIALQESWEKGKKHRDVCVSQQYRGDVSK